MSEPWYCGCGCQDGVDDAAQDAGYRALSIDRLVEKHRWNGGYDCACGAEINSPQTWSRHVLEDAL